MLGLGLLLALKFAQLLWQHIAKDLLQLVHCSPSVAVVGCIGCPQWLMVGLGFSFTLKSVQDHHSVLRIVCCSVRIVYAIFS
jgi:hypothetical protein